ncbi:MAG: hypothetical protein KJS98_16040, partial [Nitrospirae bacterium]|nr:hypothetical protein [Nitrospirota bacterium]
SVIDEDRLFLNGREHIIRTLAPILRARFTPALQRDGRSRHFGRRLVNVCISYALFLQCGRYAVGEYFFEGVLRHE